MSAPAETPATDPNVLAVEAIRESPTRVRITFSAPVTREEAWTYCGEQNDFGWPAAGYCGHAHLAAPTPNADGVPVSTVAYYTHSRSCD